MTGLLTQRGAALAVGLLMLTVMSLIAVTSMQSSTLQELMSGNMKDQATAFEAAESAIRAAEIFLDGRTYNLNDFDNDESDGLMDNFHDEVWTVIDWSSNDPIPAPNVDGTTTQPQFVIQYLGPVTPLEQTINVNNAYGSGEGTEQVIAQNFRITARGTGGSDNSVVILESVYGVAN